MQTLSTKLALSSFLLFFWPATVIAQLEIISSKYYSFNDGLPDRTVFDTHQDYQGKLWFSTATGFSMFDGYQFKNFSNIDIPNISKKINVRGAGQIDEDQFHNLIFVPWEKSRNFDIFNLNTFESKSISIFDNKNIEGIVQDVFTNHLDYCYILSKSDSQYFIYKINQKQEVELHLTLPNASNVISDNDRLFVNSNNHFWIFDYGIQKILKYDSKNLIQEFSLNKNSSVATTLRIFHEDKKGNFWFSSTKDSQLLKISNNEPFPQLIQLKDNQLFFTKIWEDDLGNLIFGAWENNYLYQLIGFSKDEKINDLKKVLDIEAKITNINGSDFSKQFYVSSHNGVHLFSLNEKGKSSFRVYLNQELAISEWGTIMRGFTSDNNGTIYVTTEDAKWYSLDTNTWKLSPIPLKDENGNILLHRDCGTNLIFHENYIWGVTCNDKKNGTIHRYDINSKQWKLFHLPFDNMLIRMILPKSKNEFWVFTHDKTNNSGDLYVLNSSNNKFTSFRQLTGVATPFNNKKIYGAQKSKSGIIWIATDEGLVKFNPSVPSFKTYFINSNILSNNFFSATYELNENQLLVGTYQLGLYIFDLKNETFSPFSFPNKNQIDIKGNILPSTFVADIIPVEKNNFLISTFNGLAFLDMENSNVAHYFNKDGLINDEHNRMSSLIDDGGNIYLGGINGFNVFKIEDLKNEKALPQPLVIKFFKYDNDAKKEIVQFDKLSFNEPIQIKPQYLQFGFDFMVPSYSDIENNKFQTWLEGWESDFGQPTAVPSVKYFRLPAGNYKLHIRAKDGFGNKSAQDLIIPINVQQVFYKTTWFLSLCIAALIGSILFFAKRRIDKIKENEKIEREQRLIQQKFVELELKTVRLQLNPHFMFNALGAIQHYIDENNKRLAVNYLSDFARLMRLFLESSKKRYVTLSEEMELIQLYVSLERMRFDDKFDVNYNIDDDIDPDMVELPSLLLQPFIENAINHGLYHKSGKGLLEITINAEEENESVECIIQDNGIGRARAAEIKRKSIRKHKSRGTEIVQERLDNLNASGEINLQLIVDDAFVEDKDCGTRVTILISDLD